ncbi:MAG: MFS transporter, partial [Alphaproteobacteria bacterium]|nr:MFS transporter [Alphaproteobacteria bacterium]
MDAKFEHPSDERAALGSRRTKLFYGFGSVAYGVKDHGFGALLLFYYNRVIGMPSLTVSIAIFIVLFFDAFIDPVVGQLSDNLRSPLGRRHPFMYAAAVPVAVSYYFLFNPPHLSKGALFFYLIAIAIVVRIFISFYEIPSSAMAPEMTEDYHQRTSFLSYRYFFGVIGGVAMAAATYRFLLRPDATHPVGQLNPLGYPRYALAAAIVMVVSILISARGTQRFVPLFRPPAAARPGLGQTLRDMASSITHRPFLILLSAAVFGTMAIGLSTALLIYFNTYFWGLTSNQLAVFSFTGVFSALLGPALAGPLSRRLEKRRAVILFYVCFLIVSPTLIALRLLNVLPRNGSPVLFGLLFFERSVSAVLGIATLILFASMIADVVEDNAVRTGRRSEGLFFAGMSFITKILQGAGVVLAGIFASNLGSSTSAHVDPAAVRHLALLYLPALIALYGTGMMILSRYKITR